MSLIFGLLDSGGAEVPFNTPADVSGLVVWFDASLTTTVTTDVGGVSQWSDISGSSNHALQASSSARPDYNGTDEITVVEATPDWLAVTGHASYQTETMHGYAVLTGSPPFGAAFRRVINKQTSGLIGWSVQPTTTAGGNARFLVGTSAGSFAASFTSQPLSGSQVLLGFFIDGSATIGCVRNGTAAYTTAAYTLGTGIAGTTEGLGFGAKIDGTLPCGALHNEFLLYNRVLSATEDANIRNYLNTKWSIY